MAKCQRCGKEGLEWHNGALTERVIHTWRCPEFKKARKAKSEDRALDGLFGPGTSKEDRERMKKLLREQRP